MAKRKKETHKSHNFRNKLLLNQWIISLFGIDPFNEQQRNGKVIRPFHILAEPIKDPRLEGLDESNIHQFYHSMVNAPFLAHGILDPAQLLRYEENIVRHTQKINERRFRPIIWKYHQWLTILFTEIYLDRYFTDPDGLLVGLNRFAEQFNQKWAEFLDVPLYSSDDLNKLCFQNATGSGKTLIMHVNLLQFQHYSKQAGQEKELSRIILLTPNERLSEQHVKEFTESGISAENYTVSRKQTLLGQSNFLHVDVLEVTKLAEQDGPNTIATRNLGDQNLLLVDEGHRGMSGKDEGVWFNRRNMLCARGFTFEYSATFEQAVMASKNEAFENSYAKCVLSDYSYRYFYEDGFGKDYHILNLPNSFERVQEIYLTACLLKYYQQLRIYQEKMAEFTPFNIEKPLWVFVGSSVTKAAGSKDEEIVASDVAKVLQFVADFLHEPQMARRCINSIITATGKDTGLLDDKGVDIFAGSFVYLARKMNEHKETVEDLYQDILSRVFNNPAGGMLSLFRIKGDSGEIALKAGTAEEPFGLINVGDAKGLCDHCESVCQHINLMESDFNESIFSSVKESSSPINLLIGSKKFVEGWDCWRVSTMGLMHVGKSEGSQIIQLFGRGVRLKGYEWSLKRSGHTDAYHPPTFITELETLNVFGIEADFMERFRKFLEEEGLPGNERKEIITIPMNVTYDFGKNLKIVRPKKKKSDGREYDFKRDAPVPALGDIPAYLKQNMVVSDWYPRIQAVHSKGEAEISQKSTATLREEHLCLLDYDNLFFELEQFKRERSWYNLNITKKGIQNLLTDYSWYILYIPTTQMEPSSFDNVRIWQQVAAELLKRYCDRYYNYRKSEYIEPRLEIRELTSGDFLPKDNEYQLIVDGSEEQVIQGIHQIKEELKKSKDKLIPVGDISAVNFSHHLYQPLLHVRKGGKIKILPVELNESEFQFVQDLMSYTLENHKAFAKEKKELFLLRNISRGKGVGFFEAQNFYPDFILWVVQGKRQYISFIEPHGLLHEGPSSPKIQFHKKIKSIQSRLNDPDVTLNSFIVSWTLRSQLFWAMSPEEMDNRNILFMNDDKAGYINRLLEKVAYS